MFRPRETVVVSQAGRQGRRWPVPAAPRRGRPRPAHAAPRPPYAVAGWVAGVAALAVLVAWLAFGGTSPWEDGRLAGGSPPSADATTGGPAATPRPTPAPSAPAAAGVRYADCAAAWAAGAAPIYAGEPGYEPRLDPDNDGIACEGSAPVAGRTSTAARSPRPSRSANGSGNDPRFDTCAQAKAKGYGPYRRGQDPEYGWYRHEDIDNDGVVCE